ncbi:hypothetical protein GLO73106DRAFT_00028370 [Gloeocapsa sp. PCC 73106]|nr:hypothetical protein GLO73106DRAFT_00028370 [Gloeocapsa sp. PCC 73106]
MTQSSTKQRISVTIDSQLLPDNLSNTTVEPLLECYLD